MQRLRRAHTGLWLTLLAPRLNRFCWGRLFGQLLRGALLRFIALRLALGILLWRWHGISLERFHLLPVDERRDAVVIGSVCDPAQELGRFAHC